MRRAVYMKMNGGEKSEVVNPQVAVIPMNLLRGRDVEVES